MRILNVIAYAKAARGLAEIERRLKKVIAGHLDVDHAKVTDEAKDFRQSKRLDNVSLVLLSIRLQQLQRTVGSVFKHGSLRAGPRQDTNT